MTTIDLTARRISWSTVDAAQIRLIREDAGQHGDARLVRLATAALRRR